ncbi:RNA-directed DNA polymerase, eukaryota, Reverse transcriptase zinc-binding domain protein [Artemisia annua]|uniref:RNA-directed DNA polymerase, eukaryota, Reverse transcriptase zinc-binding domain protein n=1 Tax=Artemisia annua TaxID=35608 RepID=A0A2U1LZB1_ARTAN|nr:RNA-directed DNA polymerase, eukaryota, Reverse transcriptase zinc-binding domain protein [Artemisia annua]
MKVIVKMWRNLNVELIGKMSIQRRQALPIQWFLMFSVASWNIRGMNQSPKQYEVMFEGFRHWSWSSNGALCSKGSRIILGWNTDDGRHGCLLGDFNASLCLNDKSVSSNIDIVVREFQDCVHDIEVSDINSSGLRFTWNQKPRGEDGILKKIDQIMANIEFCDLFVGANALFQPYRISDNSPAVLRIPRSIKQIPSPFKFSNILIHNTRFKKIVSDGWSLGVSGFWMFKVVSKLKALKKPLRKLLFDQR